MTAIERQKWERVRARGRARYIIRSFLSWGVPMWVAQTFGPLLYDAIMHKPHTPPFLIWSPALDFVFDMVLWIFGFGYLMGESMWRKHERDYDKDDHVA
jgi:hypothetical protein